MRMSIWRVAAVSVLTAALINGGLISAAGAAIVDTQALISPQRDADLSSIRAQLERDDVRQKLEQMGVEQSVLDARIATLNDRELHRLATDMQNAPAGGDVLAVIGVVFVVLLILELVGVIDIFKKIPAK